MVSTSPANEAAVDDQVDARAKGRRLARQEDGWPDQLVDGGHAAQRRVGLELLDLLGDLRPAVHRRGGVAGADAVDADPGGGPFPGQAPA